MNRNNKINRRRKQILRCKQKEMSFDLGILRKEINKLQNCNNIRPNFEEYNKLESKIGDDIDEMQKEWK